MSKKKRPHDKPWVTLEEMIQMVKQGESWVHKRLTEAGIHSQNEEKPDIQHYPSKMGQWLLNEEFPDSYLSNTGESLGIPFGSRRKKNTIEP